MFLTYEGINYNGNEYEYTIIDSDFNEVGTAGDGEYPNLADIITIIYEDRKLKVAPNLTKWLLYESKGRCRIEDVIRWCSRDSKHFHRYIPEIQKYLLLA